MGEGQKSRRRWFRFSLRTLFVVVTVFGCWLGYELNWIRQRHKFLARQLSVVRAMDDGLKYTARPWATKGGRAPGMLWLFGEKGYLKVILLIRESEAREAAPKPLDRPYRLADSDGGFRRGQSLFPEAEILAYGWDRSPGNEDAYEFIPITISP